MVNRNQAFGVRVIYVVPDDAKPWGDAKRRAIECLQDLQWFFADEMERLGHGPRTFRIVDDETDARVFHVIKSRLTRQQLRECPWKNCRNEAKARGLASTNGVVVYFHESYVIANGEVLGKEAVGSGRGRFACLSSVHLKLARREWIADNNGYAGEVFDWIDPQQMDEDTLSWNGRGRKLGDVSGSAFGAVAHELGHAFGLSDDDPSGRNRKGNLMGNGFRGMRGYFRPDLTDDFCILNDEQTKLLENSELFAVRALTPKSVSFSQLDEMSRCGRRSSWPRLMSSEGSQEG